MAHNSRVIDEFLKIAEKKDFLNKTAYPAPNPYGEDKKVIEEKRLPPPKKSIIEEAHPEPVYVAEARGDGGLVENEIEQQKKTIEMINKAPNGSLLGRYANVAHELVKIANMCDDIGAETASDMITDAVEYILSDIEKHSPLK